MNEAPSASELRNSGATEVLLAVKHHQTAIVDLGGGDTTLRRLVDELPNLASVATEEGSALVMFYHVGPQVDDLSPIATMEARGLQPEATVANALPRLKDAAALVTQGERGQGVAELVCLHDVFPIRRSF